jgi:hypothetical protein
VAGRADERAAGTLPSERVLRDVHRHVDERKADHEHERLGISPAHHQQHRGGQHERRDDRERPERGDQFGHVHEHVVADAVAQVEQFRVERRGPGIAAELGHVGHEHENPDAGDRHQGGELEPEGAG